MTISSLLEEDAALVVVVDLKELLRAGHGVRDVELHALVTEIGNI